MANDRLMTNRYIDDIDRWKQGNKYRDNNTHIFLRVHPESNTEQRYRYPCVTTECSRGKWSEAREASQPGALSTTRLPLMALMATGL